MELDEIDLHLLKELQRDCSRSASSFVDQLGLSQPAIWRRIKRFYEEGIISGKRLVLDTEKVGFSVTVFLGIKLARKGQIRVEDFERAVTAIPEVQTVEHVLGVYDYRIRIVARDISDFERILRRRIMTLPGAGEIEANVLLSEEKRQGPV
tara:strand:+ start:198 stop:650 length:453 start_codon:yes stop_codon:yes gene_type:complete